MKPENYLLILVISIFFYSCQKTSSLNQHFRCDYASYSNLKTHKDIKKNFTIGIPNNWKTNYYFDNTSSSIYTADTAVKFTETTIIDATFVADPISIDTSFTKKILKENKQKQLQKIKSKTITFLKSPTYLNLSKGRKRNFDYTILNLFIQQPTGFLHVKTEVYGDKFVDERICKSLGIVNTIQWN